MSSPFASDTLVLLDLPFDPPHTVTFKKLSAKQLGKASTAQSEEYYAAIKRVGGPKVAKEFQDMVAKDPEGTKAAVDEAKDEAAKNPLSGYDPYVLLYGAIKEWTYPHSLALVPILEKTGDGHDITVMRIPAIDDLGEDELKWFATEALRLAKPSLFQTKAEQEAAQKNV